MSYSAVIDGAISLAEAQGNSVLQISTGWTKVRQVVEMARPLSDSLRAELEVMPDLRFWAAEQTPHNKAEEGFTDDAEQVSISFPR